MLRIKVHSNDHSVLSAIHSIVRPHNCEAKPKSGKAHMWLTSSTLINESRGVESDWRTVLASATERLSKTCSLPSRVLACKRTQHTSTGHNSSKDHKLLCSICMSLTASAHFMPRRRTFLFRLCSCDRTTGPCITPPPLICRDMHDSHI